MKVIINGICYVNVHDVLKKPLPSFVELDRIFYESDEFIKLTGDQTLKYMNDREDIIDFDDLKDLTDEELEKKIQEAYKKLEKYATKYDDKQYYFRRGSEIDKKFLKEYKLAEVIYNELLHYQNNKDEIKHKFEGLINQNLNNSNLVKIKTK